MSIAPVKLEKRKKINTQAVLNSKFKVMLMEVLTEKDEIWFT